MYRVISPKKIIHQRGELTRKQIADRTYGHISEQQIGQYEKGNYKPSEKALPYLLKALGCTYEDITEPRDLVAV